MNKERILIETVFLVMAALKEKKNLKTFWYRTNNQKVDIN